MKEPFNLAQFKGGRSAITRDGRVAEFLYHREDFQWELQLGVVIPGLVGAFTLPPNGTVSGCLDGHSYDLIHMAPAKHGIEGMPWDLPAPPAPPEGMKWEYRGLGYKSNDCRGVYFAYFDLAGHKQWIVGQRWCGGYPQTHYLEASPIKPKRIPLKAADMPAICWIKTKQGSASLVVHIDPAVGFALVGIKTDRSCLPSRKHATMDGKCPGTGRAGSPAARRKNEYVPHHPRHRQGLQQGPSHIPCAG